MAARAAQRLSRRHPGVVVGVLGGPEESPVVRSAGHVRSPDEVEPTGRTLFEIGSVTKVFTALLLADAVVRQEVTLDTPVRDILRSDLLVPSERGAQITLEHLATHTSGLPRSPLGRLTEMRSTDPYSSLTRWDVLDALGRTRLRGTPGTGGLRYSNLGAAVLGLALADLIGAPDYQTALDLRVCGPLGLVDTVVVPDDEQAARSAAGHRWRGRPGPSWHLDGMAAAGAILSTADDMLIFLRAQVEPSSSPLGDAIVLTHQERRRRHTGGIGLGWMRRSTKAATQLWHNGATGGFRAFVGFTPRNSRAVVVLTNSFNFRGPDLEGLRLLDGESGRGALRAGGRRGERRTDRR